MVNSTYSLSWDSYKNNICNGFAELQQREEFVDMTLVAEGHLVKVHKNLISLASPYIKNIIKLAPCDHPIIFLINMTHEALSNLLEYIYTGEVQIELDKLDAFLKAAKELQIPGIAYDSPLAAVSNNGQNNKNPEVVPVGKKIAVLENRLIDCGTNEIDIETIAVENILDTDVVPTQSDGNINNHVTMDCTEDFNDFLKFPDSLSTIKVKENNLCGDHIQQIEELTNIEGENPHEISLEIGTDRTMPQQYTISNRGSVQMILNRYLYSMHFSARKGVKRRWRCIDYRLLHCKAYIDTFNDKITKRQNLHTHAYHDYKIMNKIKAKIIFGSLNTAICEAKKTTNLRQEYEKMVESE